MALKSWSIPSFPFVDCRSTSNQWAESAAQTGEFHFDNSGSVLSGKPSAVYIDESKATEGVLGELAEGEWAWGDADTIGYDTLYVRLTSDADPDTQDAEYVQALEADELLDSGSNTIILLSLLISNYSLTSDAHIIVTRRDNTGVEKFKWILDIPVTNSPFALDSKMVFTAGDKLKIEVDNPDVAIDASGDES